MESLSHIKRQTIWIEVGNAVTHGLGVVLAVIGLVFLMIQAAQSGRPLKVVAFLIYGLSLVLFYLASTLFHSLVFTRARHVFQVFDHSMIYLLIAGTYTPYCLLAIRGGQGITLLTVIWVMAIAGVIYKALWLNRKSIVSTLIYVLMGWMCLLAFWPLFHALGPVGFGLLLAGGVTFTLGAVLYSFPTAYTHLIWHLFVLGGTICMYFSILCFL